MTQTKSIHVPYKGSPLQTQAAVAGEVALAFDSIPVTQPFIKSGRVKALAVTDAKRSPALPDVPTIAEAGLPGLNSYVWLGMWGPPKLPKEIADKVSAAVAKLLTTPDAQERLASQGMQPVGSTPAQFAEFVRKENDQWSKVVKAAGVKAE